MLVYHLLHKATFEEIIERKGIFTFPKKWFLPKYDNETYFLQLLSIVYTHEEKKPLAYYNDKIHQNVDNDNLFKSPIVFQLNVHTCNLIEKYENYFTVKEYISFITKEIKYVYFYAISLNEFLTLAKRRKKTGIYQTEIIKDDDFQKYFQEDSDINKEKDEKIEANDNLQEKEILDLIEFFFNSEDYFYRNNFFYISQTSEDKKKYDKIKKIKLHPGWLGLKYLHIPNTLFLDIIYNKLIIHYNNYLYEYSVIKSKFSTNAWWSKEREEFLDNNYKDEKLYPYGLVKQNNLGLNPKMLNKFYMYIYYLKKMDDKIWVEKQRKNFNNNINRQEFPKGLYKFGFITEEEKMDKYLISMFNRDYEINDDKDLLQFIYFARLNFAKKFENITMEYYTKVKKQFENKYIEIIDE